MDTPNLSVAEQLRTARVQAGWCLEKVADALNLTSCKLDALELGEYSKLHGEAFVLGYIRLYADLFDLDADELIRQYKSEKCLAESDSADSGSIIDADSIFNVSSHSAIYASKLTAHFQHKHYRTGVGVAAALTIAIGIGLVTQRGHDDVVDNGLLGTVTDTGIVVDTAIGTTVIESLDKLPANEPTKGMIPEVVMQQSVAPQNVERILKQRINGETANDVATSELSSSLNFQFSADCWVEIEDGDGRLIYSSLQKAQESLQLSGKPPFRVTLGYAPGVVLSYNGKPVEIDADNANIAKLILGKS